MRTKFERLIWFVDKNIDKGVKQHATVGKAADTTICGKKRNGSTAILFNQMDMRGKQIKKCSVCMDIAIKKWGDVNIKKIPVKY